MRRAARATCEGLLNAMAATKAGRTEGQVAGVCDFTAKAAGAWDAAFPTVAGAGPNACVIHYSWSDQVRIRGRPRCLFECWVQRCIRHLYGRCWLLEGGLVACYRYWVHYISSDVCDRKAASTRGLVAIAIVVVGSQ